MDKAEATKTFHEADAAWSAELVKVFGKKSGPAMRYNMAGRGMHGSNLRAIYEAREEARVKWASVCDIPA